MIEQDTPLTAHGLMEILRSVGLVRQQEEPPTILTSAEAAAILRRDEVTLSRWRSHNKGPAYIKDGGTYFYTRKDIDSYLKRNRHETAESDTTRAAAAVADFPAPAKRFRARRAK